MIWEWLGESEHRLVPTLEQPVDVIILCRLLDEHDALLQRMLLEISSRTAARSALGLWALGTHIEQVAQIQNRGQCSESLLDSINLLWTTWNDSACNTKTSWSLDTPVNDITVMDLEDLGFDHGDFS